MARVRYLVSQGIQKTFIILIASPWKKFFKFQPIVNHLVHLDIFETIL